MSEDIRPHGHGKVNGVRPPLTRPEVTDPLRGNPQFALPLIDPFEPRILPQDAGAWFAVARNRPPKWLESHYQLADYEAIVRAIGADFDTYITQGAFTKPSRLSVHLAWVTHAFVDLDIYKLPEWVGSTPDDMVRAITGHCDDEGIPLPSAILSSGQGLYAKWFWSTPVPGAEAMRAIAVNRALRRGLEVFGADRKSVDLSRVLRVVGSINSKNSRRVSIIWLNGSPGAPATYDFDAFAREILPACTDEEPAAKLLLSPTMGHNSRRRSGLRFNVEHWYWGVVNDIRWLAAHRYPSGIVQQGQRDLYCHLAACALAHVIPHNKLYPEIVAIGREFLPRGYINRELKGDCGTVLRNAVAAASGKRVEFAGRLWDPRYAYSKARMIEELGIEAHEEPHMTRLVPDAEKERRRTERRRIAGQIERAEYEARSAARRPIVLAMRARGVTWRAIAAELGISVGEAHRLGQPA